MSLKSAITVLKAFGIESCDSTMPMVLSVETPCGSWKVKSEGVPSQCRESM
jgi:hypothetical protein